MAISPGTLQQIAELNDIVEVVSSYIKIKKSGKSFLAVCPFHPDKNPSMSISAEKQVYHCFSCGASGNVFRFVQEYEKITFVEAAKKLAERAGVEIKDDKGSTLNKELQLIYELNKLAAKYYYDQLTELPPAEKEFVSTAIKSRGLDKNTITKLGIGYAPKEWDSLLDHLTAEGYTPAQIEQAGLIKRSDNDSSKFYDRFRGRIMFPIFNETDKVVGFSGRKVYTDDESAKYINSPETKIYHKGRILYGLNFAREGVRAKQHLLLVEGQMDFVSLFKAGITNAAASCGTSLTDDHIRVIKRYTDNIYLLFDADAAGIKAAQRSIELMLRNDMNVSIVALPEGEDPDSFVTTKGKEEFEKLLLKRKSVISFLADIYSNQGKLSSPEDKASFIREIISYLKSMKDDLKRSFYIKEIEETYGIYEKDIRRELNAYPAAKPSLNKSQSSQKYSKQPLKVLNRNEEKIIEILLRGDEESIQYIEENLEIEQISGALARKTVEYLLDERVNEGEINVSILLNKIEEEDIKKLITKSCLTEYSVSPHVKLKGNSLFNRRDLLKINYLEEAKGLIEDLKLFKLEEERAKFKETGNIEKVLELNEEIKKAARRKLALKNQNN